MCNRNVLCSFVWMCVGSLKRIQSNVRTDLSKSTKTGLKMSISFLCDNFKALLDFSWFGQCYHNAMLSLWSNSCALQQLYPQHCESGPFYVVQTVIENSKPCIYIQSQRVTGQKKFNDNIDIDALAENIWKDSLILARSGQIAFQHQCTHQMRWASKSFWVMYKHLIWTELLW